MYLFMDWLKYLISPHAFVRVFKFHAEPVKWKNLSKQFQGITSLPKPPYWTPTSNTISELGGLTSSYVYELYIYTHLDTWCCLLHRWNEHALQRSSLGKIGTMYKSEGSGLPPDSICREGYSYQIFIQNYPVLKHI